MYNSQVWILNPDLNAVKAQSICYNCIVCSICI